MKKMLMILSMFAFSMFAFSAGITFNAMTGDSVLDTTLENLNIEAKTNLDDFTASISISYGVSKETVTKLIVEDKMEPADVYMTFEIATVQNQPVDTVLAVYKKNKGKGWGVMAQDMGIKPGSESFKELKENTEKTKKVKSNKEDKESKDDKGKGKNK